jgi:hypothetical protein
MVASTRYADVSRVGTQPRRQAPQPGEPWLHGMFHAFEDGATETLCHESLTDLHLFREIDFHTRNPQVCCGECLGLVESS